MKITVENYDKVTTLKRGLLLEHKEDGFIVMVRETELKKGFGGLVLTGGAIGMYYSECTLDNFRPFKGKLTFEVK